MISYVKLYGPPILKSIKALEKIALDMPEVCIMDTIIATDLPTTMEETQNYFGLVTVESIDKERCSKIVSKSGEKLGGYDFFFEWFKKPSQDELNDLIQRIDEVLTPIGCRYSITTQ
ncbi:hypothetical protein MUP77_13205 [Candidatus Bathyarchaeota archaeon]|nr:hypothetical protein [Candidatus Bathyarchaeota archaeon]